MFRAYWPKGSRERLVFELALNTGQRRGDLVDMGWQHVTGDAIHVRQNKTGARVAIPITPELRAVLDALPRDRLAFLTTATGAPSPPPALETRSVTQSTPPAYRRSSRFTGCGRPPRGVSPRRVARSMRSRPSPATRRSPKSSDTRAKRRKRASRAPRQLR